MERFRCRHKARIRKVWEKKGSHFGKRPQTMEPSDRSNLCHYLFSLGSGLESEHTRFLASARSQCYSGWSSVQQGADHRKFLQGYGNANVEKTAGHPLSTGMEKGITTDFAKRTRSQLIKEGNFTAARALDFLVCGAINELHLFADGSIPNQFFCVRWDQRTVATRKHELWECPGNRLINHTHDRIKPPCDIGAEFWDTNQVLFACGLLPRDW